MNPTPRRGQVHPLIPSLRRRVQLYREIMRRMEDHIIEYQCLNTQRELMALRSRTRRLQQRISELRRQH